jgi:NADH:ubiquinone oxidoreductase subunit 5 (subunit L)/multisubunit Na+/H+ antiporter MnhA subunit
MIRLVAVCTFLLIVGVCSYVVLNPGSYSTLVLCLSEVLSYAWRSLRLPRFGDFIFLITIRTLANDLLHRWVEEIIDT